MRRAIVIGGVPTGSGSQVPRSPVLVLNDQLACHNEDQMTFVTPMVGNVGCAVTCPQSSFTSMYDINLPR